MAIAPPFNLTQWIENNRALLKPPIGNKNLYVDADDYIVMIVAGPNARKDYHYNETVIHVNQQLVQLANDYSSKGINCIAISSNDVVNYPQDGPDKMKDHAKENHYPFPYLYDETQDVAKAYDAACTPDFFLFDQDLKLVYAGQLDGSRPGNDIPVAGEDLRAAMDALLRQDPINPNQKPSMGCNIKWK